MAVTEGYPRGKYSSPVSKSNWNLEFRLFRESETVGAVEELSDQARKSTTFSTHM